MWPVVEQAIDFVLDLQTPARRDPLGPPRRRHPVVVRPAHRLVDASATACAAPSPSPSCSATSAPTGSCPPPAWPTSSPHEPDAFAPKHRWAMDWYYPVLGGVVLGDAGRARLADRCDTFVDGRPRRALRVSDRPWITVAETCECALAHLAVGEREMAETLFGWAQQFRHDGRPLLDRHRLPRRSPLPRRRAVHLHRGRRRARRRRPRRHHPRQRPLRRVRGSSPRSWTSASADNQGVLGRFEYRGGTEIARERQRARRGAAGTVGAATPRSRAICRGGAPRSRPRTPGRGSRAIDRIGTEIARELAGLSGYQRRSMAPG